MNSLILIAILRLAGGILCPDFVGEEPEAERA